MSDTRKHATHSDNTDDKAGQRLGCAATRTTSFPSLGLSLCGEAGMKVCCGFASTVIVKNGPSVS